MIRKLVGFAAVVVFLEPCGLIAQDTWTQAVDPVPVLEIGDTWGDSEEFAFSRIHGIVVVGDSILVLDGQSNEVRVFDHRGDFLASWGGNGEGPGEFLWATGIRAVPEGIVVSDLRLRRQTYFSLAGEVLRTEALGEASGVPLSEAAKLRDGQVIAATSVMMGNELGAHPERALVFMDPRAERIDTITKFFQGFVPFETESSYGFLRPSIGSEGGWVVVGDSLVVVVSGEPPVLRWWGSESGALSEQGRVQLPIQPEPFSRRDEQALLDEERALQEEEGSKPLPRSVEMGSPNYWGQIGQVVVSEDNQCWIQWDQPRVDLDSHWFRIDLATQEVSRAELPEGFRLLAATREKLYGVILTEFEVPILTVFQLMNVGMN